MEPHGGLGLNPLHCGAVVASRADEPTLVRALQVSIPFIAGQWSLPQPGRPAGNGADGFQSPSLRGSGRFEERAQREAAARACFNPLHCGAVVASRYLGDGAGSRRRFQSPSLRGSGRFLAWGSRVSPDKKKFQSPSLRGSGRFRAAAAGGGRLNPLHCGAVVASAHVPGRDMGPFSVSIPFIAGQWSLQSGGARFRFLPRFVSIPFIAGQWSLLRITPQGGRGANRFQSPSLRGSGRFMKPT